MPPTVVPFVVVGQVDVSRLLVVYAEAALVIKVDREVGFGCGQTLALVTKFAVMLCAADMVTVHVVPVCVAQAPLQPAKPLPVAAVAVRVTGVPVRYEAEHVPVLPVAHEIPPTLDATVPLPEPTFVTDNK
jgi:hypothetical protein